MILTQLMTRSMDKGFEALSAKIDGTNAKIDGTDAKIEILRKSIDDRFQATYEVIGSLRNEMVVRFEQVDRRFAEIDRRFERLEKQVDSLDRDVQAIAKKVFPE